MSIGKRILYAMLGLPLVLFGAWIVSQPDPHWVVEILFGGGAIIGASLIVKALIGGDKEG